MYHEIQHRDTVQLQGRRGIRWQKIPVPRPLHSYRVPSGKPVALPLLLQQLLQQLYYYIFSYIVRIMMCAEEGIFDQLNSVCTVLQTRKFCALFYIVVRENEVHRLVVIHQTAICDYLR